MRVNHFSKIEIGIKHFTKEKRIHNGEFRLIFKDRNKKADEIYAAKIIYCFDDNDEE